ncbi:MAG TPA: hypothetical protein VL742_18050 [Casimicrobiaceae bacterium]|nr:hypothetical protein [Casimicrobiaceae bacterium]
MKTYKVTVPEIGIVAATRGMLGAGIGLVASNHMRPETRRAVGWTLVAVGALTTIPIVMALLGHREQGNSSAKARETSALTGGSI